MTTTGDAICAAMNATVDWPDRGDPIGDYLAAIEALGYPVAA